MDRHLKEYLIEDGVSQCEKVLTNDIQVIKNFPDGVEFFKGCLNGFHETEKFFCLEQFEVLLMKLKSSEEIYKKKLITKKDPLACHKTRKAYADCLGHRCAVEFLYNNLLNTKKA